jgi:cytochrome c oxidase subunit 2
MCSADPWADDGRTVMADEAYVRESILNPDAKVVKGYKHDIMPVFEGQIDEEGCSSVVYFELFAACGLR